MSTLEEVFLITGMMAVTFGVRYSSLALSSRYRFSESVTDALRFVPVAVLSAFVMPILLAPNGTMAINADNPYLVAGIVSIIIAAFSRHLLLTIVLGMALFLLLRLV